jgi:calcium binding protein
MVCAPRVRNNERGKWRLAMKITALKEVKTDKAREERISMEIMVDAYDASERALSWYYYLDQQLQFPFLARCITYRPVSPLEIKDKVTVIGMAPESECEHEIFVMIEWGEERVSCSLITIGRNQG